MHDLERNSNTASLLIKEKSQKNIKEQVNNRIEKGKIKWVRNGLSIDYEGKRSDEERSAAFLAPSHFWDRVIHG